MNLPSSVQNKLLEKSKPDNTEEEEDEEKEINMNDLYKEIKLVRSGVEKINSKISVNEGKKSTQTPNQLYSNTVNKQLGANINTIVKHINQERKENNAEQAAITQNRTLIVKQYQDKNIRNSESIRAPIRENFPGVVIRNARTTPGGAILIEFDNENTAENIAKNWKQDIFGGNKGVMRGNVPRTAGIVKHVWDHRTEEEIEEELRANYPCKEVTFFKKNGKYIGIIKVIFNTPEDLVKTTEERIKIFEQRYLVEEYIFKPRVIKCNKCQAFGHIARLCRSTERCGKCSENHDTKTCTVEPKDFKCFHCKGNHETGDKECPEMKNKEEQIKNRQHNG